MRPVVSMLSLMLSDMRFTRNCQTIGHKVQIIGDTIHAFRVLDTTDSSMELKEPQSAQPSAKSHRYPVSGSGSTASSSMRV